MDKTTSWVAQHFRNRMTQKEIDEVLMLAVEADKREIERLRAELAASQAREKVLRERETVAFLQTNGTARVLVDVSRALDAADIALGWAETPLVAALSLPADDTALRQVIANAQEEMRERCASLCETAEIPIDIAVWCGTKKELSAATANGLASAIRALEVKP